MSSLYTNTECMDILEQIFEEVSGSRVEAFLDQDYTEFFEDTEPFKVTKGMFNSKVKKPIVKFKLMDKEDTRQFTRLLRLMADVIEYGDIIDMEDDGEEVIVTAPFDDWAYTIKLNIHKFIISLFTTDDYVAA